MKSSIVRSPAAIEDLDELAAYIGEDSLEIQIRFFEAAEMAIQQIAAMPGIGAPRQFSNSTFSTIRMWPIPGFREHLIFYRETSHGIESLRVLHGKRHLHKIFDE